MALGPDSGSGATVSTGAGGQLGAEPRQAHRDVRCGPAANHDADAAGLIGTVPSRSRPQAVVLGEFFRREVLVR